MRQCMHVQHWRAGCTAEISLPCMQRHACDTPLRPGPVSCKSSYSRSYSSLSTWLATPLGGCSLLIWLQRSQSSAGKAFSPLHYAFSTTVSYTGPCSIRVASLNGPCAVVWFSSLSSEALSSEETAVGINVLVMQLALHCVRPLL